MPRRPDNLNLAWMASLDELLPVVYDELRDLARRRLRDERDGHTLGTTALVHEAYLRLRPLDEGQWRDRAQFFALASKVMR
ncbi:MAG TPA: ECF-type sigma factor, partial [Gemmatimonadaceae bacterium]|nr:ECF-type sigma factor [Gemmatimonadaceae bacterium]